MNYQIKKIFVWLFCIILLAIYSSCTRVERIKYQGRLLYSNSTGYLMELNLSTLKEKKIYYDEDFIHYFTKISNSMVIFSTSGVFKGQPLLKRYDLASNNVQTLRDGTSPTYVGEHNILYFYVQEKPYRRDGEFSLYVGDISDLKNAQKIGRRPRQFRLEANNKYYSAIDGYVLEKPVVQISSDKIVYRGIEGLIVEYDYISKTSLYTNISDLFPLGWRESSNELICCDVKAERFFLVEWNTKNRREIRLMIKRTNGWRYLKEYDVLLFANGDLKFGAIYSYDFKTSAIKQVINFHPFLDGVYFSE